jgi:hypothetical protein
MNNYVSDKPSFIKRHLIPDKEGIWEETKFPDVIEIRAGLILDKISKYLP